MPPVLSECPIMWPYMLQFLFWFFIWPGQLLDQNLVDNVDSINLQGTVTCHAVFKLYSKLLQTIYHSFYSLPLSFSASLSLLPTWSTEKSHCRTADSCQCSQSPGFCYDTHNEQYIQLHTGSILKHSAKYHGDNPSNSFPEWYLYAWLVPKSKSCSCLAQLAGRNTTFTAMRSVVFFKCASHWSSYNRIHFIFNTHFPVWMSFKYHDVHTWICISIAFCWQFF